MPRPQCSYRVLPSPLRLLCLSGLLLLSVRLPISQAQITLDGSLGRAGALTGPNYSIPAEVGQLRGPNLFHSFGQFNVRSGESATFTGPNTVANILGRVTGSTASNIDGRLRSQIPGANLYLINPSGVVFGPNASLDVSGSFHVSTADYLRLADGAHFSAHLSDTSTLTVAPPVAFGFLGPTPAQIALLGSTLEVPPGQTVSVIGGELTMQGNASQTGLPTLRARSGRVQLVSVASAGEVGFNPLDQSPDVRVDTFTRLGDITVRDAIISTNGNTNGNGGGGGGTVLIRGGRLLMDGSTIVSVTQRDVDGAAIGVDVGIAGAAVVTNGSSITTATIGAGRAGAVRVTAGSMEVSNGASVSSITVAGSRGDGGDVAIMAGSVLAKDGGEIATVTSGAGRGGTLRVEVGTLTLTGGAQIGSVATAPGSGGPVTVTATAAVALTGRDSSGNQSGVVSIAQGNSTAGRITLTAPTVTVDDGFIGGDVFTSGHVGNIEVRAGRLTLTGGGQIRSNTDDAVAAGTVTVTATEALSILGGAVGNVATGSGDAGPLMITTPSLTMRGGAITALTSGTGRAGDVTLNVGQLTLQGGAVIESNTAGAGQGGKVTITATEAVTIAGQDTTGFPSTMRAVATGEGSAGSLSISAPTLTLDGGRIGATASGAGGAGAVLVQVGQLTLTGGAFIDSSTLGTGPGGRVTIAATDSISISNLGFISSTAQGTGKRSGNAGNVSIVTPVLNMQNASIDTRTIGNGNAGDVQITVGRLILTDGAFIDSFSGEVDTAGKLTVGTGRPGMVTVTATDSIFLSGRGGPSFLGSGIFTLTGGGDGGTITVSAPRLTMEDGARIGADTGGEKSAGDVVVKAGNVSLSGGAQITSGSGATVLNSFFVGAGSGGTVTVTATDTVAISGSNSGLATSTAGTGRGGDITLQAGRITLADGAVIAAESTGPGNAGKVTITAADSFLSTNSRVTTLATQADGGNIEITAPAFVRLRDSTITAEVRGGPQTVGGNVMIDPQFILLQNSQIVANAFKGHGGNILISAQQVFLADPSSQVSASSALGINGLVEVRAPVTSISGTVAPLPQSFARAAELLRDRCAERLRGGSASRFILGGRDGVPQEPGGPWPSPLGPGWQETAATPEAEPHATGLTSVGVLSIDKVGQSQARRGHAQALPPGWELECVRWMGK